MAEAIMRMGFSVSRDLNRIEGQGQDRSTQVRIQGDHPRYCEREEQVPVVSKDRNPTLRGQDGQDRFLSLVDVNERVQHANRVSAFALERVSADNRPIPSAIANGARLAKDLFVVLS